MSHGAGRQPPLSPREGWLSDGRQVLHFQPVRWDRWNQPVVKRHPLLVLRFASLTVTSNWCRDRIGLFLCLRLLSC